MEREIQFHSRPIRTAFLVDPDSTAVESELDAAVDFSLRQWGGLYNPIIPVVRGSIPDPFFRLMRMADPDLVYSYTDLSPGIVDRIDRLVGPLHLVRHTENGGSTDFEKKRILQGAHFCPFDIQYCIPKQVIPSRPRRIPIIQNDCAQTLIRILKRNFGVCPEHYPGQLPPFVEVFEIDRTANLASVMEAVRSPEILFPITLSSVDFEPPETNQSYKFAEFTVIVGDSCWNTIWGWDRINLLPAWRKSHLNQLILPRAIFDSPEHINVLAAFLESIAQRNFGSLPRLGFESYDLTNAELQECIDRLPKGVGHTFRSMEPQALTKGDLPEFTVRDWGLFREPPYTKRDWFRDVARLRVSPPPMLSLSASPVEWMVETRIEQRPGRYSNRKDWLQVPKSMALGQLFSTGGIARINRNGLPTYLVSNGPAVLEIHPPNDRMIFQVIYSGSSHPPFTDDVRADRPAPFRYVELSDKGRHIDGVLQLFPTLWEAGDMVSSPFWRSTLEWLCRRRASLDATVLDQIERRLAKQVTLPIGNRSEYLKVLSRIVLNTAKHLPIPKPEVQLDQLAKRLVHERKICPELKVEAPVGSRIGREEMRRLMEVLVKIMEAKAPAEAQDDLKEALATYVSNSIFIQGINPSCPKCGLKLWFPVNELGRILTCRGCLSEFNLPIEPTWSYRLNELMVAAVVHGGLPVLWTLTTLSQQAQKSFLFFPSVNLYNKEVAAEAEVDITYIIDGKLGIAEVKLSADDFKPADLGRMERVAREIEPDLVLFSVFSPRGKARLAELAKTFESQVSDLNVAIQRLQAPEEAFTPRFWL